jgi:hypothetical protein
MGLESVTAKHSVLVFLSMKIRLNAPTAISNCRYTDRDVAGKLLQMSQCLTINGFRECYGKAFRAGEFIDDDSPACIGCQKQVHIHGHGLCQ